MSACIIICVSLTSIPSVDVNKATDEVNKNAKVHKLIIEQYEYSV